MSAEKDGFDYMWHAQFMRLIEDTAAALDAAGYVDSDRAGPNDEFVYSTPFSRTSMTVFRKRGSAPPTPRGDEDAATEGAS